MSETEIALNHDNVQQTVDGFQSDANPENTN